MNEIWSDYLEWGFLGLFLLSLVYTMRVIKREKDVYLENPKSHFFKKFHLKTPQWWGVEEESEDLLHFERQDTRYEWKAIFRWIIDKDNLPLEDIFKSHIKEQNILFDQDFTIIHNPESLRENFLSLEGNDWKAVRIEGTATKDAEKRLYYDAYLLRQDGSSGYLFAQSISSVLNGLVEGPYFEEVMKQLEVTDSSLEKNV